MLTSERSSASWGVSITTAADWSRGTQPGAVIPRSEAPEAVDIRIRILRLGTAPRASQRRHWETPHISALFPARFDGVPRWRKRPVPGSRWGTSADCSRQVSVGCRSAVLLMEGGSASEGLQHRKVWGAADHADVPWVQMSPHEQHVLLNRSGLDQPLRSWPGNAPSGQKQVAIAGPLSTEPLLR